MPTGRAGAGAWWRPVWIRSVAGLRHRLAAGVALAAMIALSAGVVMASVAGARRTDTAIDRFLRFYHPYDVGIVAPDPAAVTRAARLPEVLDAGEAVYVALTMAADGSDSDVTPFMALDDREYRALDRLKVERGRMPDPGAPFDVAINPAMAENRHLRVGSRFSVYAFSWAQTQAGAEVGSTGDAAPAGPTFTLQVSAIGRLPADLSPHASESMLLTPAFAAEYARQEGVTVDDAVAVWGGHLRFVRLRAGPAGYDAYVAKAQPILGPEAQFFNSQASDSAIAIHAARRSIHLQALALFAFAGLAAGAVLLIVGQTIARLVALGSADDGALRSIGMTTGQLVAAAACRTAIVAVPGAALAIVAAVVISPLFPLGLAGRAEVSPGVAVDVPVLLLGAVLTVVVVVGRAALAAWRPRRAEAAVGRPSRLADALNRVRLPAPAAAGLRLSLEAGGGRDAVPARLAIGAVTASVACVLAAVTFGVSLNHLLGNPREQGWNWDVLVGNPNAVGDPSELPARLASNRAVQAATGIMSIDQLRIDGRAVDAMALEDVKERVTPTVLEGAAPAAAGEIALGSGTLHSIHRHVGDTVKVAAGEGTRMMKVTGRIVVPTAGDFWGSSLSDGAVITTAAARDLIPSHAGDGPRLFAVRYVPGSAGGATHADFVRQFGGDLVQAATTPQDIENLRRVAWEPFALAGLVVVIGLAGLVHTLVTSIRRRRRDLAVLKTLGFVRRQVAATVAWQATALALVALVVGVPLGLAAGRLAWSLVAAGTGTYSPSVISLVSLLVVVPVTFAAANLLAAGPGWAAARVRPALVLRAE